MANVIDDINNNNKNNLNNQNLNSSKTINSNNNNDQNTNKLNNATINSLIMDSNIIQTNASTISTTSPTIMSTNVKRIRRYNILPGRNRFFCDGRIIMAKQISVFYFTVTLLISTCVSFFIFDSPYLSNKISPLVPIVAACLFLFVLFNLFRTSFTDPGILPRATPAEAADVEQQIVPNSNNASTMRPPPRTKEVMINNQIIKLKYCFTCKIFRPPRASHCSLCDNCVERFDHHCPWVGNCVGKRNYRFFYMFILSLAFLCIYIFSCIITHLILLSKTMTFVEAIKQSPVSVIEMIICFFSVWSILGLAGFHTYLIMSNLTTNEDIKGSFSKRNHVKVKNPYSKGSIFRNCFSILCSPIGPSLIHRRQYIYCEEKILTSSLPGSTSNVSNNKNIKSQQSQSLRFPNQAPTLYQPFQANAAAFMANDIHPTSMMPTTTPTSSCYQQQIASNNNESPQVISHQMKQSQPLNGCQSQYYVPIMKTPKQSQQFHHHPHHYADAHEQVYIGQDVDEIDKNQRYLAAQQQKSQMNNNNAAADNTVIFMPNDGAKMIDQSMQQHHHHHAHPHHYQQSQQQHHPSCQQACYYRKTSSSSSPSIRNNSAMKTATPKSMDDAHNQAILMDQNYYTNLIRKNSSTMIIDDEQQNDYCNFRPIQSQQMAQSCSHTHSNQQQQQQPHYQTSNITNPLDNNNKMTYQQASFQQQQQQQPRIATKLSKNVQTSTNNHQTMKQMNKSFN